jgi:hypothetical protein
MNKQQFQAIIWLTFALIVSPTPIPAQVKIASNEAGASAVEIRNVTSTNDMITGEVVNKSKYNLRNVELLLQYHWLWANEMHPGTFSQGRSVYLTINQEIRPGERAHFEYRPDPPLSSRADGHYMSEVSLAGFSQVIPQPGS